MGSMTFALGLLAQTTFMHPKANGEHNHVSRIVRASGLYLTVNCRASDGHANVDRAKVVVPINVFDSTF